MFKSQHELMNFGHQLMDQLQTHFIGSYFDEHLNEGEHKSLIVSGDLRFTLREWGDKPVYIILFNGLKYVFELDLSKAIESNGRFTWYLSQPHNRKNRELFNRILRWKADIDSPYRDALRKQKTLLNSGSVISKGGYLFLQGVTIMQLKSSLLNLLDKVINIHLSNSFTSRKKLYEIDDARAIEGYQSDKRYLYTKRNMSLVKKRKQKDKFACQACKFRLRIKGRYIIECHHIKPLSGGKTRVTTIDELVCLCPTCHRIAHTQSPPFSVLEVKTIRNQATK